MLNVVHCVDIRSQTDFLDVLKGPICFQLCYCRTGNSLQVTSQVYKFVQRGLRPFYSPCQELSEPRNLNLLGVADDGEKTESALFSSVSIFHALKLKHLPTQS